MSDDHKSTFSGPRGKDRLVEWYGAVVLQSGRCASQPLHQATLLGYISLTKELHLRGLVILFGTSYMRDVRCSHAPGCI